MLKTYLKYAPKGFITFKNAASSWLNGKLNHKKIISQAMNALSDTKINWDNRIKFSEHHLSHSASAFFPSPFEKSAVLTLDGVGEWATVSVAIGNGKRLKYCERITLSTFSRTFILSIYLLYRI